MERGASHSVAGKVRLPALDWTMRSPLVSSNPDPWDLSRRSPASLQTTRCVRISPPPLDPLQSPFGDASPPEDAADDGLRVLALPLRRTRTCPPDSDDTPTQEHNQTHVRRNMKGTPGSLKLGLRRTRTCPPDTDTECAGGSLSALEAQARRSERSAARRRGASSCRHAKEPSARRRGSSTCRHASKEKAASCFELPPALPDTRSRRSESTCSSTALQTPSCLQMEPHAWTTPSTSSSTPGEQLQPRTSIRSWRCGSKIGQGSYGAVYKALELEAGMVFAVKKAVVNDCNEEDRKYVEKLSDELEIFRSLRHPNIVSFLGHEVRDGTLCIFMEYVPGGSLAAILSEFGALEGMPLMTATAGMLQGLSYLHTRSPVVVHRDVKSGNVLVDADFNIKLSDFGCSKRCDVSTSFTTQGSIPWMAPEVIVQDGYGRKADIWSLGCTCIELATAELPWGRGAFDNPMNAMRRIGMSNETPPVPEVLPPALRDLIQLTLQREPNERPSASRLLCHDYFQFSKN
eukprot:TRINITY_DN14574_c0_g1_i3.p1 TRINITY_DN14574_c0_g1~~TRINITY_DN14574_c0_g1_i3.p1  ORF type:complete len:537 (+),score=95.56 TRINITY_DN14574_c0_g1_i3:63-1613(+)